MRKPAKVKKPLRNDPFRQDGRETFDNKIAEICNRVRIGWLLPYEPDPDDIVPPRRPRRRQYSEGTYADDPRLTKTERKEILAHPDRLEKARATFKKTVARLPDDVADRLLGCAHDIADASYASGQLDPHPILGRLRTANATASRDTAESRRINRRTDAIIRELAKPHMTRQRTWTLHSVAVEIRPAVSKRLKAERFKPLSAATIRRRLKGMIP
jgi:hypothetical protein